MGGFMKKIFTLVIFLLSNIIILFGCTDSEKSYKEKKQKELSEIQQKAGNR